MKYGEKAYDELLGTAVHGKACKQGKDGDTDELRVKIYHSC